MLLHDMLLKTNIKKNRQSVSRVLYPAIFALRQRPGLIAIHLGSPLPELLSATYLWRRVETLLITVLSNSPPNLVLLQTGFALAKTVTGFAVSSYLAFSTLPERTPAVIFCGTFPWISPAGRYPVSCFHEARTFLISGFYLP